MNTQPAMGKTGRWLMVTAIVAVVATVVAALLVMDPPSHERAERLDRIRLHHLQLISQRIDMHVKVHDALPSSLAPTMTGPGDVFADPVTGTPYQYKPTGERTYRLCATFDTELDAMATGTRDEWRHRAGQHCFEREVGEVVTPGIPVPAHPPG